jgi:tight adherence protein B
VTRLARLAGLGAVTFLLLLLTGVAVAQDTQPLQIRDAKTDAYPIIAVTVSVDGETDPDDIRVFENRKQVSIVDVRPLIDTGAEIDVVLVLDTSRSVRGEPLEAALTAAKSFVETLPPGVPVGLVTFSNKPRVLLRPTANPSEASVALDTIDVTQPGTRLYDAVVTAAGLFSGSAQHNVVLFTDGVDSGGGNDLAAAVRAATGVRATVYSVGLNGAETNFSALQTLSRETGGTYSEASAANLSALFESLASRLSRQYLVQYRSLQPAGVQVSITVEAADASDTLNVLLPQSGPGLAGDEDPSLLSGLRGLAVVLGLSFLAALTLGAVVFGSGARARQDRKLARRMAAWTPRDGSVPPPPHHHGPTAWIPQPFVQAADAVAEAGGFKTSLDRKLERAGVAITPGEVVAGSMLAAVAGILLGWLLFQNVFVGLLLAVIGASVPFLLLRRTLTKRIEAMQAQLPDVLMVLASSMRAGHSFLQALDTVAKELGEPSGPEFARVVAEIRLGRPFEDAMMAVGERVGTSEFKWAVLGVNVQREVGGNLAEILDTLSETVREREAVRRQVKVLSAEGRLSIKILIAMPFLMTAYLVWINTEYMRLLWTTRPGWFFMVSGAILMVVGAIWARKTVKIDV